MLDYVYLNLNICLVAYILGHVDGSDQISWIVIFQTLYTAAVSLGCLVLGL